MDSFLSEAPGFVPCDPSELFIPVDGGFHEFAFGVCYQVFRPETGDTILSDGSPTISHGSYSGPKVRFKGVPDAVLVRDGRFYAALFRGGLHMSYSINNGIRFDWKKPVALAVAKDLEIDGRIRRDEPRPFQISPRR